jgi:hypothetical protein
MAINFKKFFLSLISAIVSALGKREKIKVRVCKISGYLPSAHCTLTEEREYYKKTKPGEYGVPITECVVCQPDDPVIPPPEKIKVTVCTVSGRLPSVYCKTIVREFLPANVPINKCVTCKAPWPAKAKYPLYVFVPELLVAKGDIAAWAERIRRAGVWGVRIFLLQSWSSVRLVPWEQATYNGTLVTLYSKADGVNHCPVTDMTKWNAAYFTRLAEVMKILKEHDLDVIAALGDNCSFNTRNQKLSYPFMASLQTMSKAEIWPMLVPAAAKSICTDSPGGVYGTAKYPYYKAWINKAVAVLKASGVGYRLEIQNEFSRLGWDETAKEPGAWYSMMVQACVAAGVPESRIVHSGDQSITLDHGGVFAMHGIAQAGLHDTVCPMSRLMLSSDGAYAGKFRGRSETDYDAGGHRGPSIEDAIAIAKMIRSKGIDGGYEIMVMNAWRQSEYLANVDNVTADIFAAVATEWAK